MNTILKLLCIVALSLAGCTVSEGDRCNPLLFNDDCTSTAGLTCQYPANCGVAFCCPAPDRITATTNPNCLACPGPDLASAPEDAAIDASFADLMTTGD